MDGIKQNPTFGELPNIEETLRKTWEIYKRRIWTFLCIGLVFILIMAGSLLIFLSMGALCAYLAPFYKKEIVAVDGTLGFLCIFLAALWCQTAFFIAVVNQEIGFKESLQRAKSKVLHFTWLTLLYGLMITGGYLLLVIPGIIFTIWFFSASFVLIVEDLGGLNALMKSKEYVRGKWFDVAWRLFIVWMGSAVISTIPMVGAPLSLLAMPFGPIFAYLLYEDLKAMKRGISSSPSTRAKWGVVLASFLGFLLFPAILLLFFGSLLLAPLATLARQALTGGFSNAVSVIQSSPDSMNAVTVTTQPETNATPTPQIQLVPRQKKRRHATKSNPKTWR